MNLTISYLTEGHVRITTDERFCKVIMDWLTPYVKREVRKASEKYECVSYREAFDQVLIKEDSQRADRFQIYQEIIDAFDDMDFAKINE